MGDYLNEFKRSQTQNCNIEIEAKLGKLFIKDNQFVTNEARQILAQTF